MHLDVSSNTYNEFRSPEYFYRTRQEVYAYDEKNQMVNDFEDVQDFRDDDLRRAREKAFLYIEERHSIFPDKFIFDFVSPWEHELNPNKPHARYSYSIAIVQYYSDNEFEEFIIDWEDEHENQHGLDEESFIWESLGIKRIN